jgi:hypothetical protein
MTETIGCAIAAHRELGPGYIESIYRKAMCLELAGRIVKGLIVVELKAVERLDQVHQAQLISYLKTTRLRGGLLINFGAPTLRQGLRRVVV